MEAGEIVRAATQAINEGRLDDALTYYAHDVVQRSPATDGTTGFKIRRGRATLRAVLENDARHGVKFTHGFYICQGDCVATQGINSGLLNGVYVEQPVGVFYEVRNGLIVSVTVYYDRLALQPILHPAKGE